MKGQDQEKKKEGIEAEIIIYFSSLQGGNTEKAKEARQRLVKLGYEVDREAVSR